MNLGPPDSRRPGPYGKGNRVQVGGQLDGTKHTPQGLATRVAARDTGMQLAADAAEPNSKASVRDAVDTLVARGAAFTAEEVRDLGVGEPDSPAAWGAVFRAAARAAGAQVVGYRPASRPVAHARAVAVWVVAA